MPIALRFSNPALSLLPVRDRRLFELRALPLYCVIALAVLVSAIAVASGRFAWDPRMVSDVGLPSGFFLMVIWAIRWAGGAALADLAEALLLGMLGSFAMTFCAAILASADLPMADAMLARADAILFGFDRGVLTAFGAAHPWFVSVMRWSYTSLGWTPQVLLVVLFFTGRARFAWLVTVTLGLTLTITIGLCWILPAYGVPPYPYRFVEVLDGLRSGQLRTLDTSVVTGLVTFPSLHAANAAVLAWAYAKLGRLGWPLMALNVLMVASAVVVGGHYVVDVVAGLAIAFLCVRLATHLQAAIERRCPDASSLPAAP